MTYIVGEAQHDLGCTVPTSSYILGHKTLIGGAASVGVAATGTVTASKTEITDLELTIGVDEKVTGLEVTMKNIGGMDVLEAAESLVDEGLEVGVGQRLL